MISRWCREEKAVVVLVYAERSRRPEAGDHHFRRFRVQNEGRVRRSSNRRAELLGYATHLRASSSTTGSSSAMSHHTKQLPTHQISRVDRRQKVPSCLETLECIIPSFFRSTKNKDNKSVSFTTKIKALVNSLKVKKKKKKGNFMSELWTRVKKRR